MVSSESRRRIKSIPIILEFILKIEYFDFNLAGPIMGKDSFIRLTLPMLDAIKVLGIGSKVVSRSKMR